MISILFGFQFLVSASTNDFRFIYDESNSLTTTQEANTASKSKSYNYDTGLHFLLLNGKTWGNLSIGYVFSISDSFNATNRLSKSGGAIPKTGNAFYDDLAINSQHFDKFISGIESRGFRVKASKFIPANNPAFIKPGNRTFYYNPNHFTKLDMRHELLHFQQLKNAGNLKTGKGLLQKYELDAYQFERNLGLQNNFSDEYMQFLDSRINFYSP